VAEEHKEVDKLTGTATTGHEWDGLKELNTPLPRWWLWTFYATIVWGIAYCIAYPAWPLLTSTTEGVLGWHTRSAVVADLEDLNKLRGPMTEKLAKASLQEIANDPQLSEFARAAGKAAFADNCSVCHGAGGGGSRGFPNLTDDNWLWGGKLEDIANTNRTMIRVM
jgi:cytochrome c oxidase cbb3-type subunit 3